MLCLVFEARSPTLKNEMLRLTMVLFQTATTVHNDFTMKVK